MFYKEFSLRFDTLRMDVLSPGPGFSQTIFCVSKIFLFCYSTFFLVAVAEAMVVLLVVVVVGGGVSLF